MLKFQTIFTADGERQRKTYNFCTNDMIYGYEQDIKTGGQCSNGDNGMPDENCMFFVSQQTRWVIISLNMHFTFKMHY